MNFYLNLFSDFYFIYKNEKQMNKTPRNTKKFNIETLETTIRKHLTVG